MAGGDQAAAASKTFAVATNGRDAVCSPPDILSRTPSDQPWDIPGSVLAMSCKRRARAQQIGLKRMHIWQHAGTIPRVGHTFVSWAPDTIEAQRSAEIV